MRKRWDIKNRFLPQLNSYRIFAPDTPLIIHDLFDLITKVVVHNKQLHAYTRYTVAHGMSLLGLDEAPMTAVWLNPNSDSQQCMNALCSAATPEDEKILSVLWTYRHQLARLPETWKNQIEGHPILGSIPFHAERLELASIADDIMGIAGQSLQTMYNIDTLILKIWGIEKELPQKTMQDLAYRYPEVMELNEWYSYADFSVQKPTTNKSQE